MVMQSSIADHYRYERVSLVDDDDVEGKRGHDEDLGEGSDILFVLAGGERGLVVSTT
jgi:hypothetical protein